MVSPQPQLPIWSIVAGAYSWWYNNVIAFARIAALPLILVLAINLPFTETLPVSADRESPPAEPSLFQSILTFVELFILSAFAVRWIRFLLAADRERGNFGFELSRRAFVFFAYQLLFAMSLMLLLQITVMLTGGGASVLLNLMLTAGFLFASAQLTRFFLVLPGLAIDNYKSLGWAWNVTGRTWLQIFAIQLLTTLPVAVLLLILLILPMPENSFLAQGLRMVNIQIVMMIGWGLWSAAFALLYRWHDTA